MPKRDTPIDLNDIRGKIQAGTLKKKKSGKNKLPAEERRAGLIGTMIAWGVQYDYRLGSFTRPARVGKGRETISTEALFDWMFTEAPGIYNQDVGFLKSTIRFWREEERVKRRTDLIKKVLSLPTSDAAPQYWDTWINAICKEGADLSKIVIQHWVWCVKRKMLGLKVLQHMCPIFYGRTGSGKSEEVHKFLSPVADLMMPCKLDQITDDRVFAEFPHHFVIYIDEMSGAKRADLETLKNLITADVMKARPMRTNCLETYQQNAMLMGSSNHQVADIIRDATSGRRYWQVLCKDRLDYPDPLGGLEDHGSIPRELLWGSIDPYAESPLMISGRLQEIQDLQHRKLRYKTGMEVWAEEKELDSGDVFNSNADLWASWVSWASSQGELIRSQRQLTSLLCRLFPGSKTKKHGGIRGMNLNKLISK